MNRKRALLLIAGFIILLVIIDNGPMIFAHLKKYSLDQNKEVSTEIKVVSPDELLSLIYEQNNLARKLKASSQYSLVAEEVRNGYEQVSVNYMFLLEHPDIKDIKIEFPVTRYKDNEETIEFIAGKGKILEVFSHGEWKSLKTYKNELGSRKEAIHVDHELLPFIIVWNILRCLSADYQKAISPLLSDMPLIQYSFYIQPLPSSVFY